MIQVVNTGGPDPYLGLSPEGTTLKKLPTLGDREFAVCNDCGMRIDTCNDSGCDASRDRGWRAAR